MADNKRDEISRHTLFRHRLLNTIADLMLYTKSIRDKQMIAQDTDKFVDKKAKDELIGLLRSFEKQASSYVHELFRQRYKLLRRYADIEQALETIPVLKTAIQVYIDNILSPDDITKSSFKIAHIEGLLHTNYEQFIKRIIDYLEFERLCQEALYQRLVFGCTGLLIKTPTFLIKRLLEAKQNKIGTIGMPLYTETVSSNKPNILVETRQTVDSRTVENILETVHKTIQSRQVLARYGLNLAKSGTVTEDIADIVLEQALQTLNDPFTQNILKAYVETTEEQETFEAEHKLVCEAYSDKIQISEQLQLKAETITLRNIQVQFTILEPAYLEEPLFTKLKTESAQIKKIDKKAQVLDTAIKVDLARQILHTESANAKTQILSRIREILNQQTNNKELLEDDISSIIDLSIEVVHPSRFSPIELADSVLGYFIIAKKGEKLSTRIPLDISTTFAPERQNLIAEFERQLTEKIEDLLLTYLKDKQLTSVIVNNDQTIKFLTRFLTFAQSGEYEIIFVPAKYFVTLPMHANPETSKGILDNVLFFAKLYYIGIISTQIYRLTRAPERFVYYIDIGAADRNMRVYEYLKRAIQAIKSRPTVLGPDIELDRIPTYIGIFEDLFVPVYNGQRAMEFETIQGGDLNNRIEDLEHLLRQMLAGLGIPPSLLGYTEEYEYRTTLANQNVRFAKTIIRLQKEVSQTFTDLLHKAVFIVKEKLYADIVSLYRLYLPPPRGLMLAELSELARSASEIADIFSDIYERKLLLLWLLGDIIDIDKYSTKQLEVELQKALEKTIRKGQTNEEGEEGEEGLTL